MVFFSIRRVICHNVTIYYMIDYERQFPTSIKPYIVGISVFAVGITNEINEDFLAAISGDVGMVRGQQRLGYDYFTAPDFQSLDAMYAGVTTGICQRIGRSSRRSDGTCSGLLQAIICKTQTFLKLK